MSSAWDRIELAANTSRAELVAKSFRLSKRHDVIVGAVNQQKRRRRRGHVVDGRELLQPRHQNIIERGSLHRIPDIIGDQAGCARQASQIAWSIKGDTALNGSFRIGPESR